MLPRAALRLTAVLLLVLAAWGCASPPAPNSEAVPDPEQVRA